MNKIIEIDKSNLTVLVESGLILDNLKEYLDKEDLYFPINLSSSGSCMIGGNIATNAGGINALKYGTMKDNVIGIEMITGNGTLLSSLSKMKKNNTGYDLKSLVSSSEGTLGMITKALLKIYPKPSDNFTFFVAYENLNSSFMATRYHSLYLDSKNFPKNLLISARSNDDNIIMSFRHKDFPIYGLQYHPESIETKVGNTILDNCLNIL